MTAKGESNSWEMTETKGTDTVRSTHQHSDVELLFHVAVALLLAVAVASCRSCTIYHFY